MIRKVIALTICFIMAATGFVGGTNKTVIAAEAKAEDAAYSEALKFINGVGIFENVEYFKADNMVTMRELLETVYRLINAYDPDTLMENAYKAGYIDAKTKSEPERIATLDQTVKILTDALGYGMLAYYNGGFPTGYRMVDKTLGLTKGVAPEEKLTGRNLAVIVENLADIDINEVVGISSEGTKYQAEKGVTIFAQYHNIYGDSGVITGDLGVNLYGGNPPKDNEIYIYSKNQGAVFDLEKGGCVTDDFIGSTVKFYYKHDKSADRSTLLYIAPMQDESYTVYSDDILEAERGSIRYYGEDGKADKELKISPSARTIYNGKLVKEYKDAYINDMTSGYIAYVKNDYFSTLIIMDYKPAVVTSVDMEDKTIYAKTAMKICLDDYKYVSIKNEDGVAAGIDNIKTDTAIAVAINEDAVNIVCLPPYIEGRVTGLKDDEVVTINDQAYKLCEGYADMSLIDVGASYRAYLGYDGKIFALDDLAKINRIGILINFTQQIDAFSTKTIIKIFNSSGKIEVFELAEKIDLDGVRISGENFVSQAALFENGVFARPLIIYKVNANGRISSIDTEHIGDENGNYLRKVSASDPDYNNFESSLYKTTSKAFGYKYAIDVNTVVFSIPSVPEGEDPRDVDEKLYSVYNLYDYQSDYTFLMKAYTTKPVSTYVDAVVVQDAIDKTPSSYPVMVEDIVSAINSEGEIVTAIKGLRRLGEFYAYISNEYFAEKDYMPENGDVILVAQDNSGEIIDMTVLYETQTNKSYGELKSMYVFHFDDGLIKATDTNLTIESRPADDSNYELFSYKADIFDLIVREKTKDKYVFRPANYSDILSYVNMGTSASRIFVYMRNNHDERTIIINK